jgi:rare lipoprotein A
MESIKARTAVWFGVAVMALWACIVGFGARPLADGAAPSERKVVRGYASWYSTAESKAPTASGEALDDSRLTAAMWGVPFGTRVRVTSGGRSCVVRINDRGPARRLVEQGRVIDLSRAAFAKLAALERGVIPVEVQEVQ